MRIQRFYKISMTFPKDGLLSPRSQWNVKPFLVQARDMSTTPPDPISRGYGDNFFI